MAEITIKNSEIRAILYDNERALEKVKKENNFSEADKLSAGLLIVAVSALALFAKLVDLELSRS